MGSTFLSLVLGACVAVSGTAWPANDDIGGTVESSQLLQGDETSRFKEHQHVQPVDVELDLRAPFKMPNPNTPTVKVVDSRAPIKTDLDLIDLPVKLQLHRRTPIKMVLDPKTPVKMVLDPRTPIKMDLDPRTQIKMDFDADRDRDDDEDEGDD